MSGGHDDTGFLDDLAGIVDGDPALLEEHANLLAESDEARDLRHEATRAASLIAEAGADFVPPADLEHRWSFLIDRGIPRKNGRPSEIC